MKNDAEHVYGWFLFSLVCDLYILFGEVSLNQLYICMGLLISIT